MDGAVGHFSLSCFINKCFYRILWVNQKPDFVFTREVTYAGTDMLGCRAYLSSILVARLMIPQVVSWLPVAGAQHLAAQQLFIRWPQGTSIAVLGADPLLG